MLESLFTILEVDVAIICGCLVVMKPLFKSFIPERLTVSYRSRYPKYGSSSGEPPFRHGRSGSGFTKMTSSSALRTQCEGQPRDTEDVELVQPANVITVQKAVHQTMEAEIVDGGSEEVGTVL